MSRRARHVCAFGGIAALGTWLLVACGPAEASYEGNTVQANQHAGGEFSPSPDDAEPDDDTAMSPGPPTSADAGAQVPDGAATSDDVDAGGSGEATPPPGPGGSEFCNPEVCDGLDNDCDGEVDEGLLNACGACGALPVEICDGLDNDCDGQVDEGLLNACGACGALPVEICDGRDNDCDGQVDEGVRNACGSCGEVPRELCDNGRDDDCDGQTDCQDTDCGGDCVVTCEESEGHGCNGDPGYGDRCAPSDNTGGCTAARFWAWCNRRNTAYPDIWDNYLRDWVADRCGNTIVLMDLDSNNYDEFVCTSDEGVLYRCTTPLVIALDPSRPVDYLQAPGLRDFDLSAHGDGSAVATAWPSSATPWLALDRDGDGRISSGRELFGSATLTSGGLARHGFEALAELDHNGDGRIDARDPRFAELLVWFDDDADRLSAADELLPLTALGVQSLSVQYRVQPRCDADGNCERERATLDFTDAAGVARQGAVIDVHLRLPPPTFGLCL